MIKKSGLDRRQFLASTATVASFTIIPRHVLGTADAPSANNKLNIASVGPGGMGSGDIRNVPTENVVAVCDVDANRVANVQKQFPQAKGYSDFRKMLDAEKSIDAVMIATPDHNHAVVTMAALKMGKHVFCQKPLTHSVYEAIEIGKAAKAAGVATQMGNQGQASEGARLVSEFIWAGASARSARFTPGRIAGRTSAARHPASQRDAAGSAGSGLEPVARPVARAALSPLLPAVQLARLVGFRHGRAGRYRLPQPVGRFQGAETGLAGERRGVFDALERAGRDQE